MKNHKNTPAGYGKILDAWQPPQGAGRPVGCLATTFTFSAAFFEEECLSRFLNLESDPHDEGAVYLIEREEAMAQTACAAVLVDGHHCRGSRSLRWDLLPIRLPAGLLHAKVSLLYWESHIRLIIASANLTEDGYRRNLEIYGQLDYHYGSSSPLRCLRDTAAFLREVFEHGTGNGASASPARKRIQSFLARVLQVSSAWGVEDDQKANPRVHTLFITPNQPHAFEQLQRIWPTSSRPDYAAVMSPFFDHEDTLPAAVDNVWNFLRRRGRAVLCFYLETESIPTSAGILIHAPQSLLGAKPQGRPETRTCFTSIVKDPIRPLHAKGIGLEDDRWCLYLAGSSNFTRAGLGLIPQSNREANLVYLADSYKDQQAYKTLKQSWPDNQIIDLNAQLVQWLPVENGDETATLEEEVLPRAFDQATLGYDGQKNPVITFHFIGNPPKGWSLGREDTDDIFYDETTWAAAGKPAMVELGWNASRPPSGFWVHWADSPGQAWWPVNVVSQSSLPPPDELKELPLEVLMLILTSARPLHQILGKVIADKPKNANGPPPPPPRDLDPHKRVDTSRFLLQRTRRVSAALKGLRNRLEKPFLSRDALHWRLYGPVGVMALAEALVREAQSEEEKAFLLSELALELSRIQPQTIPGGMETQEIRDEIQGVISHLGEMIPWAACQSVANLHRYVENVFQVIGT